jgi:hypothetical protein
MVQHDIIVGLRPIVVTRPLFTSNLLPSWLTSDANRSFLRWFASD